MPIWLLVFIGGGAGSVVRYGISRYFAETSLGLYVGTFIANMLACFVLGMLITHQVNGGMDDRRAMMLMAGFCGGFSTFSTFSAETLSFIETQQWSLAILYVVGSIVLGLLAVYLGMKIDFKIL